jgi:hypothetical protein
MATPTTLPSTFVAGNVLTAAQMNNLRGAFRVLQVVSATKSDTFSTTSTTFTDATGLSVSITPSATTSKVLVFINLQISQDNQGYGFAQIVRDSTAIGIGDTASNRSRITVGGKSNSNADYQSAMFLDSPSTTSATTYKVQVRTQQGGAGATVYLNRTVADTDTAGSGSYRSISTITVMEISA